MWVAGPAAGGILADWGADVVKIEPPGMSATRPVRSARCWAAICPSVPPFEMDNRSKRSVVLDLSKDEAKDIALELIDGADVFLTNLRLGALARLGFDHKTLCARNPRLVYGFVNGYGLEGDLADFGAYDIAAFWARSGIANSLRQPDWHPPFQRGGMGDHNSGLALAAGISAALFKRERSGEGQLVSTSLLREGLYTLSFDLSCALRFGVPVGVASRKKMGNPCINNYQDKDGRWFWIVGLEGERHWPPLCRAVGHPEWLTDERYADPASRFQNAEGLIAQLDEIFATKTREEWGEIFDAEDDLWWAPVQDIEEVLADPQARAAAGSSRCRTRARRRRCRRRPSTSRGRPGRRARCRPSSASTATTSCGSSAATTRRSRRCAARA